MPGGRAGPVASAGSLTMTHLPGNVGAGRRPRTAPAPGRCSLHPVRPVLSALQGAGEAEVGQDAGVEAGHGADLVAGEGDDDQPGRVPDASLRVLEVHAEGGLPVGPGRYEAGSPAWPEGGGGQVPGGQVTALVLQWMRWHPQRDVLGEQGDDGRDVAGLVGAGEALDELTLSSGARVRGRLPGRCGRELAAHRGA